MTQLLINRKNSDNDKYNMYEEDLIDLNESQRFLLEYILDQSKKLDNIETNIDKIDSKTIIGKENLIQSSNYNISYKNILLGGIVCSMFISPFGYLLGLKTGSLISMTGILIGSVTTYNLQKTDI